MTTVEAHKDTVKELLDDINEKIRAGLIFQRQKIVCFSASEAATNLFAILLHKNELIPPGYNVNHLFFSSIETAKRKFDFEFPRKSSLLPLLVEQEQFRKKLCYGKRKEEKQVTAAIENFFKIKGEIERELGESYE